ncbi:Hypothetical predicted protein [Podarcis lilfordi]|uniref:Uncharacterized protein n=1 Tax=Podarcis lilfordi TaxID=74358 RepID=A0AA35P161_9SAUR|nr:Hypothetical predicted protein [Podarcis lilfordi]
MSSPSHEFSQAFKVLALAPALQSRPPIMWPLLCCYCHNSQPGQAKARLLFPELSVFRYCCPFLLRSESAVYT